MGVEDIDAEEVVIIPQIPPYVPSRKPTSKVNNDPDSGKFQIYTPFLPEDICFEGNLLAQVPFLKMEDYDLGDHAKFPQLEPSKYLKSIYYEESGVMRLELMKWVARIEQARLLNMLCVPHFS